MINRLTALLSHRLLQRAFIILVLTTVSTTVACSPVNNDNKQTPATSEVAPTKDSTETEAPTPTEVPTETPTQTPKTVQIKIEMPEKFEDLQTIKLSEVEAVYHQLTQYYEENGWPVQGITSNGIDSSSAFTYLPTDEYNLVFLAPKQLKASMFTVDIGNGESMYLIAIPGTHSKDGIAANGILDRTVFCFLYDPKATSKFVTDAKLFNGMYSPEAIFTNLKSGKMKHANARILTQSGLNQSIIESQGWQSLLDIFNIYPEMRGLDSELQNYYANFYDQATRDSIFKLPLPIFDIAIQ